MHGDREQLSRLVAGWEEATPAADDFFVRPGCGDFGVERHENVHVVIHDGKPADADGEDTRKFLQAIFDPFFAVERFLAGVERGFAQQQCAADTAGNAVIPAKPSLKSTLRSWPTLGVKLIRSIESGEPGTT